MPLSTSTEAYAEMVYILQRVRKERGMTQLQLATLVGKPQAFISNVERGARRIDVIEFCVLARVLGIDPIDLFTEVVRVLPHDIEI